MTQVKFFYKNMNNQFDRAVVACLGFVLLAGQAHADYDIGGPDTGVWAKISQFVQDMVNLVDGPVALAFSFFSIAGMALTWAFAPKFVAALGVFARVSVAVIIILNIGAWIAAYQS